MNSRAVRLVLGACLLSIGVFALGGCPLEAPPADGAALGPAPGSYYVEQCEGELYYYQLPEVRGEDGRWIELSNEGLWFTGPGFYQLSEEYTWSRDENAEGLTLDEIIQLHDPPPAVPD